MDDGWLIIIAIARRHILVMNLYVAYWWRGKLQCLEGSFTRHATRLQSEWKMEWKREKKWVARFVVLFSFENVYLIYTFAFQLVIHLGSLQFIFNLHTRVLMFVY